LAETAIRLGLYDEHRKRRVEQRLKRVEETESEMRRMQIGHGYEWRRRLEGLNLPVPQQVTGFAAYTHRQDVALDQALELLPSAKALDRRDIASLKAVMHYDGYLQKQEQEVARFRQLELQQIPAAFDYQSVQGLSMECRQRLQQELPRNLGQASRMPGITPAAISCLMMVLRRS